MESQTDKQRRAKRLFDSLVLALYLAFVLPLPCLWLIEGWPKPVPVPRKEPTLTPEEFRKLCIENDKVSWGKEIHPPPELQN